MYPEKLGEEIPYEFPEQDEDVEDEVMAEDDTASEVDEMFGDTIFDENEMGLSDDLRSSFDEVEEEE